MLNHITTATTYQTKVILFQCHARQQQTKLKYDLTKQKKIINFNQITNNNIKLKAFFFAKNPKIY